MTPEEEHQLQIDYNTFRYMMTSPERMGYKTCPKIIWFKLWEEFKKDIKATYKDGWEDCRKYYRIVAVEIKE